MTTARCDLMPPGQSGTFHIVARCVRRSFLWGFDRYSKQNYDHRKPWVEQRILLLSNAFAVSLLSYTVMSNHLHLVIANQPAAVTAWSDQEIAERWVRIFPPTTPKIRLLIKRHVPIGRYADLFAEIKMVEVHTFRCGLTAL